MTYHCGMAPGLPIAPREPHVTCDGCGRHHPALKASGMPYAWMLAGKAPKGWLVVAVGDTKRHYCGLCTMVAAGTGEGS